MAQLEMLIERLRRIAQDPHTPTYATEFDTTLDQIAQLEDPACIELLLDLFVDDAPYHEMMYSIIHLIESFEPQEYIASIIHGVMRLRDASPEWAATVYLRVLNSNSCRQELVRQVGHAEPDIKASICDIMNQVRAFGPEFAESTTEVKVAAGCG